MHECGLGVCAHHILCAVSNTARSPLAASPLRSRSVIIRSQLECFCSDYYLHVPTIPNENRRIGYEV